MLIFHVSADGDWAAVPDGGTYDVSTRGASLAEVGYLHASFHHQVDGVLDRFYGDADDLALLVVETDRLTVPWRVDPVGDDRFPHVLGPLRREDVVEVVPLTRTVDGAVDVPWLLPTVLRAGDLAVRAAGEADRPLLAAFFADAGLREHLGGPLPPAEARARARGTDLTGWAVVEDGGVAVGLVVLERRGPDVALSFVVLADHQGRGVATAACRAVLDWRFALDPDLRRVTIVTQERNTAAHALARRLGGEPVEPSVWAVPRPDTDA